MPKPSSKVGASYRITRILAKGSLKRGSLFDVKRLENKAGRTRFTIIVSKKAAALAVDRNRIKRRIKEALAKVIKERGEAPTSVEIPAVGGAPSITGSVGTPGAYFDYIIIGKTAAQTVEFLQLTKAIDTMLPR